MLHQDFTDWEMVIVDDASTDGSAEIADTYAARDPRIRVIRHAANEGAAATWNHAVRESRGRYVKLLCNDDTVKPGCFAAQVRVLDADTDGRIGLVTGRRDVVAADGSPLRRNHGLRGLPGSAGAVGRRELVLAVVRTGTNPIGEPPTVMLRRAALDEVGGFAADWQYVLDLATYAEIARTHDIAVLRSTLATFRVSDTSWSAVLAHRQAAETRRLIRELTADLPRWRRWQGYAMAEVMQALRRAAFLLSRLRTRRGSRP